VPGLNKEDGNAVKRSMSVLLVLALALGACSSDDSSDGASSTADDSVAETTTTAAEEPNEPVDQASPAGANGIKVDGDGDLWIAVLAGDEILRVAAESGEILARFDTPPGSGPDDLVVEQDGTVYWTGYSDGSVGVIDETDGGEPVEVLANVGEGANPIAFRDDGVLVVGRAVVASGLYAVEPEVGASPTEIGDPGAINSFDISPEGVLYGPLPGPGAGVAAVDPDTGAVEETIAVPGAAFAVRWFEDQLYVLTLADARATVQRVDLASGAVEPFGDTGLSVADNLAVAEDGTVYVTGFDAPTVAVLSPEGQLQDTLTIGAG
jgi:sugar lactone lactonase YvrE